MNLDQLCIIADDKSDRYIELQGELEILTRFVFLNSIDRIYKYDYRELSDSDRSKYSTNASDRIAKLNYTEGYIPDRALCVCLNHLTALEKIAQNPDPNQWSMICEDDIYIPNKSTIENDLQELNKNLPNDADLLWISSGKKSLDSTFRNVSGFDLSVILQQRSILMPSIFSTEPKIINERYIEIPRSRYADCILIKNHIAKFIAEKFMEHKFATPIDWEYNYILTLYPQIVSYWMIPAILQQNPKFL